MYPENPEGTQVIVGSTRYTSARQNVKPYEKKHENKRAGPSRDSPLTFKQHFFDVPAKIGADTTVGRLSNNCFPRYQAIGRIFEKSR